MAKLLLVIAITVVYFNPALAEIKELSTSSDSQNWRVKTLCVEGYVVFHTYNLSKTGGAVAFQLLNHASKPIKCEGAIHKSVIGIGR